MEHRWGIPLPKSLSVGARQKFATGPDWMSSSPINLQDLMLPFTLSKITES